MNKAYKDIIERCGLPEWYDDDIVPRYCAFHPQELNIYAKWAMLGAYACQACGKEFLIASVWHYLDIANMHLSPSKENEVIQNRDNVEWVVPHALTRGGDPPRHCCAGDTMLMDPQRAIELWQWQDQGWTQLDIPENLRRLDT